MDKEKLINQLNKLLIKKAEGFYYTEEAYEYSLENKKEAKTAQLSFFDEANANEIENKNFLKTFKKGVSKKQQNKNDDLKSGQEEIFGGDLFKEKKVQNEDQQTLTLSKKKVTTHFVPPDMLAIKMLFEIASRENNVSYDSLTDEELVALVKSLTEIS